MTLTQEPTITPVDWEAIAITFYISNPDIIPDESQSSEFSVLLVRSDGSKVERKFDFLERLTDDAEGQNVHLPALQALKLYSTARVESEILNE